MQNILKSIIFNLSTKNMIIMEIIPVFLTGSMNPVTRFGWGLYLS